MISFVLFSQEKKVFNQNSKDVKIQNIKDLNAVPLDMLSDALKKATKRTEESINQQSGIVYDIISSRNATIDDCFKCRPAPSTLACPAKYVIETRRYTEYKDGSVIKVWMSNVSLFNGCGRW